MSLMRNWFVLVVQFNATVHLCCVQCAVLLSPTPWFWAAAAAAAANLVDWRIEVQLEVALIWIKKWGIRLVVLGKEH